VATTTFGHSKRAKAAQEQQQNDAAHIFLTDGEIPKPSQGVSGIIDQNGWI
jgi:hypothetical protein